MAGIGRIWLQVEESLEGLLKNMKVNLAYGEGQLPVELPEDRTTVIAPRHTPGLTDERTAVINALERPIAAKPLKRDHPARR